MKKKKPSKAFTHRTTGELARATAEFDEEFIADTFGPPDDQARKRHERASRKRGRPQRGAGAIVISVSVEQSLLRRTDRLARKLKVSRARLIKRGLRRLLDDEAA